MIANRLFPFAALAILLPVLATAGEPPAFGSVLDTGKHVYEQVIVLRVTPTHIFFRHSRGMASLPISQLPPEVRVQIEDRIPQAEQTSPDAPAGKAAPASPPRGKTAPPPAWTHPPLKEAPRTPAIRTRPLWVVYPIRNHCPSPLGTGTFPGPRGLPLSWFVVHPCVYPQTLANPDWRKLAERDFFLTAARHNPALLTRQIVSGW